VHAEDDWDIPYTHSAVLFSAVLDPHLPPEPEVLKPSISYHPSEQEWAENRAKHAERRVKRDALITTQEVDRLGTLQVFPGGVYHLQTKYGGHNPFQLEGVQNLVRDMFQLRP
jgi:abhydrolase domain-containing protein 12